ncbi:unnamed protein product [Dovyalis caffra]|uniref:Uncharacterized protein n=1 Tax=Dovyalis caffra TaxID=77055 RepID=A0AAV1SN97_9ROSI|nr:unnamed protein product [Dovyalis caffra]
MLAVCSGGDDEANDGEVLASEFDSPFCVGNFDRDLRNRAPQRLLIIAIAPAIVARNRENENGGLCVIHWLKKLIHLAIVLIHTKTSAKTVEIKETLGYIDMQSIN